MGNNDLISRNAALELCQKEYDKRLQMFDYCGDTVAYNIGGAIKLLPSVDAVPVVRCKDCIYRDGTIPGQPNIICFQMHDYDFCSYGERKEPTNGIE